MPSTTLTPYERATLIYDGDCGFCTSAVHWLERNLPIMPKSTPFQWAALEEFGLTREEATERVWVVIAEQSGAGGPSDGDSELLHQYGGYLAISVILRHQPHLGWRFLGILLDTPPFSVVAGLGYSLTARFRYLLPGGTPACKMRPAP